MIPDDAKVRAIIDTNGNTCGFLFGRYELPWPLIETINKNTPTTGYHGVNYYTKEINES